eukprot:scaffold1838_cov381-Prasinococcus_capsulatus_cf.AAC.7
MTLCRQEPSTGCLTPKGPGLRQHRQSKRPSPLSPGPEWTTPPVPRLGTQSRWRGCRSQTCRMVRYGHTAGTVGRQHARRHLGEYAADG